MKRILFIALLAVCMSTTFSYGKTKIAVAESKDSLEQIEKDEHVKEVVKSMDEYLREIAKEEARNELQSSQSQSDSKISQILEASVDVIIPLVAIVTPFAMICIVIYIVITNETRRRRMKYNMVEKAIDHGQQLPEYVFYSRPKEKQKNNNLNNSIILISVGFAITLFFIIKSDYKVAALVSMIFLIGAGKLIVYILDRKKQNNGETTQENGSDQENIQA